MKLILVYKDLRNETFIFITALIVYVVSKCWNGTENIVFLKYCGLNIWRILWALPVFLSTNENRFEFILLSYIAFTIKNNDSKYCNKLQNDKFCSEIKKQK